jgi:peptide/nickel transport system substrate-binding protein
LRDKTFRTIGATSVLLGIAIAAMAQAGNGDPSAIELAASEPLDSSSSAAESSVTFPGEFEYRVGLLAGVSTANFWEYIGGQPTAWNAYVLGPTKPALHGIDPATNDLIAELAASDPVKPTWDETGWRVRVEIRDDLAWSDAEPVTAADVVYTFETVRRLGLAGGWAESFPPQIEAIAAESDTELRIEFTHRPSLRVWPYGVGLAPIMPAHVWQALTEPLDSATALYELDGTNDVSGGPLQIVSLNEERIESVANPGYPVASINRVAYTIFADEASAVSALETGEIDTVLSPKGLSAVHAEALGSVSGVTIEQSPANSVRYLGFNLSRAPMSEPAFRQALALLLDREAVTETLVPSATAAYTMLSAANTSWFDEEKASAIAGTFAGDLSERLTRAISALQAAGYAWTSPPTVADGALTAGTGLTINGRPPVPLTILTPGDEYDPARPDYTRRIEATLETLGFDVRPVITDFDTVVDLAFTEDEAGTRQYDMYLLGWTLGNPALPDYYHWLFAADGAANSTGYSDPDFGAQLSRYEKASEVDQAKTALWDMEKTLAEDLPYLVLYHPDIIEAYRSDRVRFENHGVLGGIQGRLGGIEDLSPAS